MSLLIAVAIAVSLTDALCIGICIVCWRSIWLPIIDLWHVFLYRREMCLSGLQLKDTHLTGEAERVMARREYPHV